MNTATESLKNTGRASPAGETSGFLPPPAFRQLTLLSEDTLASLSATPGSEKARKTTAISGRSFAKSLPISGPLGVCLKMLLGTLRWASTRCFLTWKAKDTPQSRLIFQLAQSTPRTSGAECGFWHTPNVPNGGRVNPPDMSPTGILANGKKRQVGLEHQVRQVEKGFWPTPKAAPSGPDYARATRAASGGDDLATAVHKAEAFFPTPRASDGDKGGPNQKIGGETRPGVDCGHVPHADGTGCEEQHVAAVATGTGFHSRPFDPGWCQWPTEPGVGRVAHGIPRRVDRIKGLGNAVVPELVCEIGCAIRAAHYGDVHG